MLRPNYPIRRHFTSLLNNLDSSSLLNMSRISDNTRDLTGCHMPLENISIRQNRNLDIVRLSIFLLLHCLPFMHIFWKTCWVDLQVSSRNLLWGYQFGNTSLNFIHQTLSYILRQFIALGLS